MQLKSVNQLLDQWQGVLDNTPNFTAVNIEIAEHDLHRIQAFAKVYHVKQNQIIQDLIKSALDDLEASIPYVQGSKVIREEDGDPIYEDVGIMPQYLKAKRQLNEAKNKRQLN